MNIIGRILVVLNLVFALVVGGFLVVDFATRTNWQNQYKKLQDEMAVSERNWTTGSGSLGRLDTTNKQLQQERDAARKDVTDRDELFKAQETSYKVKLDDAERRAKDADLTAQIALGEKERLNKESQGLLQFIKQRDEIIVGQQADIVKFRNAAVSQESAYKAAQDRLEQALARNAELEKTIAKGTTGGTPGEKSVAGKPNPPSVFVEARIEAIEPADPGLVQISAGSDKGLNKDHTLEAYRVSPPLYLGMIRIIDVTPHQAVGRLERIGSANRTPLRVGDTVASTLSRN